MSLHPRRQTALDEAFISVYNLFYTSLPVLALGVFDQDVKPQLTFKVPRPTNTATTTTTTTATTTNTITTTPPHHQ